MKKFLITTGPDVDPRIRIIISCIEDEFKDTANLFEFKNSSWAHNEYVLKSIRSILEYKHEDEIAIFYAGKNLGFLKNTLKNELQEQRIVCLEELVAALEPVAGNNTQLLLSMIRGIALGMIEAGDYFTDLELKNDSLSIKAEG